MFFEDLERGVLHQARAQARRPARARGPALRRRSGRRGKPPHRRRRTRARDRPAVALARAVGSIAPGCRLTRSSSLRQGRHRLLVAGRSLGRLRADGPLVSASGDLDGESPVAERGDDQAAARVGGIGLGMTRGAERHQPVEIEVRAPLGALDDVVDFEGAPAGRRPRRLCMWFPRGLTPVKSALQPGVKGRQQPAWRVGGSLLREPGLLPRRCWVRSAGEYLSRGSRCRWLQGLATT